jgi:hypothetical protein
MAPAGACLRRVASALSGEQPLMGLSAGIGVKKHPRQESGQACSPIWMVTSPACSQHCPTAPVAAEPPGLRGRRGDCACKCGRSKEVIARQAGGAMGGAGRAQRHSWRLLFDEADDLFSPTPPDRAYRRPRSRSGRPGTGLGWWVWDRVGLVRKAVLLDQGA